MISENKFTKPKTVRCITLQLIKRRPQYSASDACGRRLRLPNKGLTPQTRKLKLCSLTFERKLINQVSAMRIEFVYIYMCMNLFDFW